MGSFYYYLNGLFQANDVIVDILLANHECEPISWVWYS
jgi:hypothetical protein